MDSNPFAVESPLPYHAPDFSRIALEHYEPAIKQGMVEQEGIIDAIVNTREAPTFANTVEALEKSSPMLDRTLGVFLNLCAANTSPDLQALQSKYAPLLAAHRDSVYLNDGLYQRIKEVASNASIGSLTAEQQRLIEVTLHHFTMAGAHLGAKEKEKLKDINKRLAALTAAFGDALLEARQKGSLVVKNKEELDGLSAEELDAAKEDATKLGHPEGTYVLMLVNTVQQPLMAHLNRRETRRRLLEASMTRATNPEQVCTTQLLEEMVRLRLQKAKLMGKETFTEWKLQDQMANQTSAHDLLKAVSGAALKKAQQELEELKAFMNEEGITDELQAWDWCYYQEKLRKKKYALDDGEVKPYMELSTVLEQGVFYAASQLYGIRFEKRTDLPVYDADVVCYEVFDKDGTPLALYFIDPYARESKRGGAWMTNYVDQCNHLHQRPVVYNVLNVEKPVSGPTLLTPDHLRTLFHEFGHALHGMLAMQQYASLSGTSVPRDFVEFPSQINEKWALENSVLKHFAFHYETKQPIPDTLVEKMKAAELFGAGFHTMELMKASVIDLAWHMVSEEKAFQPTAEMEKAALAAHGLTFPIIPPRYTSSIFAHIFAGGYSSGYYAYTWAKVLDCDGFEYFLQHGGLTRENGEHFRQSVLSVGNAVDPNVSFEKFTGHREPSLDAYLRLCGLQ